ncbi:hypothetical protein FD754_007822 [Muntiacus muntjak]|uniref:CCHC-type domain-containing protein n=1 Tax=Muntiacus muntjak TaxID=9888 RepID=A0A5N3WTT0_MUNMU|nr:hypothetical protein FD754_007822 [Muntiacus muntjak]
MYINAYNREQGPAATGSVSNHQLAGGCTKYCSAGFYKCFNVCLAFGFLSMTRPLKEVETVEFTFKKSVEGLASVQVTSPGMMCYNCGGLDHHAKECNLTNHMVASYLLKAQQAPSSQEKQAYFREEEEEIHSPARLPEAQK